MTYFILVIVMNMSGINITDKSIKKEKLTFLKLLALRKGFSSLKELATHLNVTYWHLYKVIIGERQSRALQKRLIELLGEEVKVLFESKEVGDD